MPPNCSHCSHTEDQYSCRIFGENIVYNGDDDNVYNGDDYGDLDTASTLLKMITMMMIGMMVMTHMVMMMVMV